jgi:hypothetical protein
MRGYWRSVAQHADTIPVAARPRQSLSSSSLLKKCEPGPRLEVGRSPRLAHEHNRQSLLSLPTFPSPVRIVRAQMRHQGGSAGEILGRKLARSDPQPWWGWECQVGTARRIARTIFLGSAPSSVVSKTAARGLDRAHIILGCLQPGQTSSVYADALSRLSDRLHYLNTSGDRSQDATRASGSTLAPTCARKWKIANGASTTRGSARQDRRCSQEDRFQALPDAPTRW